MKKTELIIAITAIVALVMNLFLIPGSGILIILTFGALAFIYEFFSFLLFNNIKFRNMFKKVSYQGISAGRIVGAIIVGFALALTMVGILFKIQFWPGANVNLGAGLVGLLIATIIGLIKYLKSKADYYAKILKRNVVFGAIGLALLMTPATALVDFKYRNHPDYANAMKRSMADPNNQELRKEEKDAYLKMISK